MRGQRGLDAAPNRDEVLQLVGLVQDGAAFVAGGIMGTPSGGGGGSYGRIPDAEQGGGHKSKKSSGSSKHKKSSKR